MGWPFHYPSALTWLIRPLKQPNLDCFINRVASHPERLQYIYFDTILLLRAVARLGPYLSAFDYCSSGNHEDDAETLSTLTKVIDIAKQAGSFDETILFRGENANVCAFLSPSAFTCLRSRSGTQGRIQDTFPERHSHHGLRGL